MIETRAFVERKQSCTKNRQGNEYLPRACRIVKLRDLNHDVRHFTLRFKDGRPFEYLPGQFVQVSLFGVGEAPISITSSSQAGDELELAIRRVGALTNTIHTLGEGDELFVRGPYGNSFDYKALKGHDVIFVAGGVGLVPLRSLIRTVLHRREDYDRISLLYGARCPGECLYMDEVDQWSRVRDFQVHYTVDSPDEGWKGNVGVVTILFEKIEIKPDHTVAFICGPPIMIKFANLGLEQRGMDPQDIITTMEMHMKCGIGKCGHCNIGQKYCCTDGPVFSQAELKKLDME